MAGKKISQLSGSLSPSLTGYTIFDNGSTTYKTTLQTLRTVLVDSGSHSITGSLTAISFIGDGNQLTNLPLSHLATTGSNLFKGNQILQNDVDIVGELTIGSVSEKIVLKISGGTSQYEFDYHSGSVFYLTSSLSNNSYNVSNAPIEEQRAVSITFVIKQESTPYIASSYKLNNENITVKWANNEQPVGNSNKTDIIGLTALRIGSSWNVLGTFTTFG
jgi:hypothetical protein